MHPGIYTMWACRSAFGGERRAREAGPLAGGAAAGTAPTRPTAGRTARDAATDLPWPNLERPPIAGQCRDISSTIQGASRPNPCRFGTRIEASAADSMTAHCAPTAEDRQ